MRRIVFSFFFFRRLQPALFFSFPNQPNRDKISTRKFDVGVFTQPGPGADIGVLIDRGLQNLNLDFVSAEVP